MGPWFAPAPVGPPVPFHSQQTFPCMGKILLLSHYLPQTLFLHAHEWRLLHPYGNQLLVSKPLASRPPTATACDRCGACPLLSRIWAALLFKPNLTLQPNLQNPTKLRIIHFRDMKKTSKFLGQDWRLFDCKEPEALILMCRKTAENNTRFLNAISSAFVRAQRPRRWVAVCLPWRPGALTSSVGWSSAQRKLDVWDRRRRGVTRLSNQARRTKRRRRRKKRKKRRQRKKRRPKRAVQFVCGAMQTFQ